MSEILREFIKKESKGKDEKEWIQNIAAKVNRCCLATHISGFTHSGTKIAILAENKSLKSLGYVVTEWEKDEYDVLFSGGAREFPIAKFLKLKLEDTRNIIYHILIRDKDLELCLSGYGVDTAKLYDDIKKIVSNFRSISPKESDERLRQVFFPVSQNEYHLLTVMPSSLLLVKLKEQLESLQKNSQIDEEHKVMMNDNILIKVGGAQAQNISFLNNQGDRGKFTLLNSFPPFMEERAFRYPKYNFFLESTYGIKDTGLIYNYHNLKNITTNYYNTARKVEKVIEQIIDLIIHRVYDIRTSFAKKISDDKLISLPNYQRRWILGECLFADEMDALGLDFARWFIYRYKQVLRSRAVTFGDDEIKVVARIFKDTLEGGI